MIEILGVVLATVLIIYAYFSGLKRGYSMPRADIFNIELSYDEASSFYLAHDMSTQSFLAQNLDREDLIDIVADRYSDHVIVVSDRSGNA
jgi:hypothetical protein